MCCSVKFSLLPGDIRLPKDSRLQVCWQSEMSLPAILKQHQEQSTHPFDLLCAFMKNEWE